MDLSLTSLVSFDSLVHAAHVLQDVGSGIYVEHAGTLDALWHVVSHRIPLLLSQRSNVRLVVIDSIAALFRAEYGLGAAGPFDVDPISCSRPLRASATRFALWPEAQGAQ